MNRVGDVGLALAIFLMFKETGTVSFSGVFARIEELAEQSPGTVTVIALLLLLGACGKSGQVPLQAWLPDAMEGPTPVSALIHAATMVTAGVYLIARCSPIYDLTADGGLVVAIVGTVTLLVGCIGGCAKDDIKKVLAYSTVSQIGYMFLAVGLGAGVYALGILLLLCHGFFKAGLFLGAGSIMHAMNDDVDMRHYGGLARKMPITFVTMLCAYLAIIGFPLFDGFYAKDPIIEAAFAAEGAEGWLLGSAALLGAGITAFYMTRLMIMTFFGEPRWKELKSADGRDYHPHESPLVMTVPMIILAVGSVGAGAFFAINDRLANWLAPSVGPYEHPEPPFPAIVVTDRHARRRRARSVHRLLDHRPPAGPGHRPDAGQPGRRAGPRRRRRQRDQRGAVRPARDLADPCVGVRRREGHRRCRERHGRRAGRPSGRWRHWQNGFVRSTPCPCSPAPLVVIVMLPGGEVA